MTSDESDTIINTDSNQYEVNMYHNHNYADISEFGLESAPYIFSTNKWKEFVRDIDFDEITASADHAKHRKVISLEHLRKV